VSFILSENKIAHSSALRAISTLHGFHAREDRLWLVQQSTELSNVFMPHQMSREREGLTRRCSEPLAAPMPRFTL
jgi:hypothetical protein